MQDFILRAKIACYVGGGAKTASPRPTTHVLTFQDGDLQYRDSYFGGTDFIGQGVVSTTSHSVWATVLLPHTARRSDHLG